MKNKPGRNDTCPCGSGKKYKKCCLQHDTPSSPTSWVDEEGLHLISKDEKPSEVKIEEMTKEYQNKIRKSPLCKQMVDEYGLEKAEELLKEFKAEVK